MRRLVVIVTTAILVGAIARASIASANSNGILSGRYAGAFSGLTWFTAKGSTLPKKVDFASNLIGYFDGKGNYYGNLTTALGFTDFALPPSDEACTYTQTGSYSLNDDDTGTLSVQTTVTSGNCESIPQVFSINATQGGSRVCIVQTNAPYTGSSGATTNSIVLSGCLDKQ